MKHILLLLPVLICFHIAHGQSLKRYPIGKSGCSALCYCNPGKFEVSYSPDSSVVYTSECSNAGVTYDVICVKLKQPATDMSLAEGMLEQYLDFLQTNYEIVANEGHKKGLTLKKKENTRGISDSWKDKDNNTLTVKGWTNGKYIAVLMAIAGKKQPDAALNAFLEGVSFPEK